MPAKERPSVPHLGEGEAWKSPSRGRLACPPLAFSSSLPATFFFSNSNYIKLLNCFLATWAMDTAMDTRPQARLRQKQAQQHQDQSQQRPAAAARRAQNRQRERFSLGLTMANAAQPESIVTNKSAAARLSGVCSTYCFRCIALCTAALLYCCTG